MSSEIEHLLNPIRSRIEWRKRAIENHQRVLIEGVSSGVLTMQYKQTIKRLKNDIQLLEKKIREKIRSHEKRKQKEALKELEKKKGSRFGYKM